MLPRLSLALVLALAVPLSGAAASALEPLTIDTASGHHAFKVEVMRNDADRERGLMFRRSMPEDQGMLFDFKTAAPVMMWMKNTYIPLDMIFVGADGRILSTAVNAEPMSERIIPSGGPALGVLEVNAGTVARIGAKPGDRVHNGMFPPLKARHRPGRRAGASVALASQGPGNCPPGAWHDAFSPRCALRGSSLPRYAFRVQGSRARHVPCLR